MSNINTTPSIPTLPHTLEVMAYEAYPRTRMISTLLGHKDPKSILSRLPKEILKEIILLASPPNMIQRSRAHFFRHSDLTQHLDACFKFVNTTFQKEWTAAYNIIINAAGENIDQKTGQIFALAQFLDLSFKEASELDLENLQDDQKKQLIIKMGQTFGDWPSKTDFTGFVTKDFIELWNKSPDQIKWTQDKNIPLFPSNIGRKKELLELNFTGCGTRFIPPEIGNLTNLYVFCLSHAKLTQLPVELFKLTKLEMLGFAYNQITDFPAEIGNLKNLKELYLSNNKITEIPIEIAKLQQLRQFYVRNNEITQLPIEIGTLPYLKDFSCTGNKIRFIPDTIKNHDNFDNFKLDSMQEPST